MSDTTEVAPTLTAPATVAKRPRSRRLIPRPPAMRGNPYLWLALFLLVIGSA